MIKKIKRNEELEKGIIKYYNEVARCRLQTGLQKNQDRVHDFLQSVFNGKEELESEDLVNVKKHIDNFVDWYVNRKQQDAATRHAFRDCFGYTYLIITEEDKEGQKEGQKESKKESKKEDKEEEYFKYDEDTKEQDAEEIKEDEKEAHKPVKKNNSNSNSELSMSLDIIGKTLATVIAQTQADNIKEDIMSQVQQSVKDFIKSEYGRIERKVTLVVDGKKKEMGGIVHDKFDTVLKFVANNEPVFLTGPAGSGKNFICKQVADALDLKFYFTNAVTQEYKLTGFTDANGKYQPTQFYKAFTEGGVFMLDEMDASIPEVLVILNAAIANRYFDFPAPIGYVEAHPDFRVIAAGNTIGHGADYEYVGRNQLDAASLDRFAIIPIDYSKEIEDGMAMDEELANFCREFRTAAKVAGVQCIVSYRAIGRLAKMLQLLSIEEALETCLIKGLEKDDIHLIYNNIPTDSKYKTAMKNIENKLMA